VINMIEHNKITTRVMDTIVNPDPANGTTVPNAGIAAARPKPRGKRATLAAVVSAGLTLFGLGLAAGTAQAAPGLLPTDPCIGADQDPNNQCPGQKPRMDCHYHVGVHEWRCNPIREPDTPTSP
jgi:hypothetical protein